MSLTARVKTVDVNQARELAADADPGGRLTREAQDDLRPLLERFVLRTTVLAALVGAVAAAVLPWRRWTHLPLGALGGALAIGGLLGHANNTHCTVS